MRCLYVQNEQRLSRAPDIAESPQAAVDAAGRLPMRQFALRAAVLAALLRVSSGYVFGDVVEAVQTPDGDVTVSGVYSTVMFTLSDDYPYACKCVQRSETDTKVGYCKILACMEGSPSFAGSRSLAAVGAMLTVVAQVVTGKRFFAKGVAYNPRNEHYDHSFGSSVQVEGWVDHCVPGHPKGGEWTYTEDVISDEHEAMWSEDLDAIANLGANTVRLYNVDPKNNHSKFMEKAASLGIYVIEIEGYGNVGVNALSFAKQVVKEFSQFNNTLLFTVANELAQNDKNGWAAFPCVKALTRDVHLYQKSCGSSMRRVPLIYSDVDMGAGDRGEVARYLTCALDSEEDAVDVYGLNVYSWCDETYPGDGLADNFQYSPYYEIKKDFKDLAVPMLFTEFGCNLGVFKTKCPYPDGRTWPEVKHLVGKDMGEIISGAIAFQFSMDKEEYGLTLSPNFLVNQTELYLLDNYFNLQKVFHEYNVSSQWDASPSEVAECNFTPSEVHALEDKHHRPTCPSEAIWMKIMRKHRVDKFSNWTEIPPSPDASETALWHVGGQAECPAEKISVAMQKNNECHENGTADVLSTYDFLVRSHLAAGNIEGAMKSLFEAGKPLMKTCKNVLFSLNGAKDLAGATRSFVAEALMSSLPALGVQPSYPMYKDMVNLAATVGNIEMAEGWSQQLREDGFTPDAALYVLLIEASRKAKEPEKAIAHFNQMVSVEVLMIDSGFEPNWQCYEAVLEAAQSRRDAELQDFWEDLWLKRLAGQKKKPDRDIYNVLIGVPAKYGNVKRAELWLTKMRKAHKGPGTNNWNSVLKACEVAKDADNAQKILNRMINIKKGAKPDATSYNHVIKACAKAGKPKLAIVWFRQMKKAGLSARGIQFNEVIKASASSATISADYAAEWVRRALVRTAIIGYKKKLSLVILTEAACSLIRIKNLGSDIMASGGAGDGDGTVRVRREVFASALRRLDAQLAQARQNAEAISERSREYRELRGVLAELPEKVSHPVMVPFGPMASFPGQLVHTNEVLCQLSSEYFALRTTGNALKMVDRRLRRLQDEQTSADRELQELSLRRRLAGGEAESANSGSGPAGSSVRVDENGFLDIREPLEPEPALQKESSGAESAEEDAWKFWQNPAARDRGSDSTLSRLRELEQMEEGSDGPAEAPSGSYEDELSELDRIVESYADAEAKAGDPMNFDLLPEGAPKAQAPSPADLFRLMESSERRSKSYPSPEAPGAPGAQGAQGALEHLGVSETVREHSQVALSLEAGYAPSFQAYKSVIQAFLNEKNMDAAQLWLQWMKGNGTTPDESIYLEFIRSG
eukprot:s2090_g3.t3